MKYLSIVNLTNPGAQPIRAKYCDSFLCQLRGLMFTKSIPQGEGLLLVQSSDSRINSSIHMMFMWIDLAVIWINSDHVVVDKVLAKRWKLAYLPRRPAKYVLETDVSLLPDFNLEDKVSLEETSL